MSKHPQERICSTDTRKLLTDLIAAREEYSSYLRAVATGERQPDLAAKELLKMQCDETLYAWRAAHEAWQQASSPLFSHKGKTRVN